jgi:ubiquinone/menaquinone biosynthesis C-methylase UbiE
MDIAAGPGRYLIEIAQKKSDLDLKVFIRDHDIKNINLGKMIVQKKGLNNVNFFLGDAFSPSSYKFQDFKPNILVISGLFELFPDNDLIVKAIQGATDILEDDGVIIYTGQPWHPQLDLIAKTLNNRDDEKWVMRRRTQRELDELFAIYGAEKQDMLIDKWGIFTVSKASFKKRG